MPTYNSFFSFGIVKSQHSYSPLPHILKYQVIKLQYYAICFNTVSKYEYSQLVIKYL